MTKLSFDKIEGFVTRLACVLSVLSRGRLLRPSEPQLRSPAVPRSHRIYFSG
jgi:hypothetical protein